METLKFHQKDVAKNKSPPLLQKFNNENTFDPKIFSEKTKNTDVIFDIKKSSIKISESPLGKTFDIDPIFGKIKIRNLCRAFPLHNLELVLNISDTKNMERNIKYQINNVAISKLFNFKIAQIITSLGSLDIFLILPETNFLKENKSIRIEILKF